MGHPRLGGLETERGFQDAIIQLARYYGFEVYHTWDSRHSVAGFPDLVLGKPGRLVFVELKTAKGTLTAPQLHWLEILRSVPQCEAYLWRPDQWDVIHEILRRRTHAV